jgi:hypothetical protein
MGHRSSQRNRTGQLEFLTVTTVPDFSHRHRLIVFISPAHIEKGGSLTNSQGSLISSFPVRTTVVHLRPLPSSRSGRHPDGSRRPENC